MLVRVRALLVIFILLVSAGPARSQQERDRARIPDKYKWNLADLYPSDAVWRTAKDKLVAEIPQFATSGGHSAPAQHDWPTR